MMKNKKIVIAGGTGFIGRNVADYFGQANEVVILGRKKSNDATVTTGEKHIRFVSWNITEPGDWMKEIDGADLVINLAGKSVNCRYTSKNKQAIMYSRVQSTKAIGDAIAKAERPPTLWINAASATIYRHATDRPQDEHTGEMHNDFSVQVCKRWEQAFFNSSTPATRKIVFRAAITLGNGSVMIPYLKMVNFGLGGKQGTGEQMFSWVHINDVVRAIEYVFTHGEMEGVYNLSAPEPVKNIAFMRMLRKATGNLFGLPAYDWMLKLGALLIGTEAELVLKSRWVIPARLLEAGFTFAYPTLQPALEQIVSQIPQNRYRLI